MTDRHWNLPWEYFVKKMVSLSWSRNWLGKTRVAVNSKKIEGKQYCKTELALWLATEYPWNEKKPNLWTRSDKRNEYYNRDWLLLLELLATLFVLVYREKHLRIVQLPPHFCFFVRTWWTWMTILNVNVLNGSSQWLPPKTVVDHNGLINFMLMTLVNKWSGRLRRLIFINGNMA